VGQSCTIIVQSSIGSLVMDFPGNYGNGQGFNPKLEKMQDATNVVKDMEM
jgi:hypothetical protein